MTGMRWYHNNEQTFQYTRNEQAKMPFEEFLMCHPEFSAGRLSSNK